MAKLTFAPRARRDIAAIGDFIARDDPARAENYVAQLERACAKLLEAPRGYPVIGDLRGHPIRKKVFPPYLILYTVVGADVRIAAVVHGSRRLVLPS